MLRALTVLAVLGPVALAGCAASPGSRMEGALSEATRAPEALTPEEIAEARRLQAMPVAPRSGNDLAAALWSWDWRSALSGRGRQRAFFSEGGAAYAAALAGRPDATLTPMDRLEAADAALDSARRSAALAEATHARAVGDVAALRAAASPDQAFAEAAEARGALLTAMAAAASADAAAVAQDAEALGFYAGPARRVMAERAAALARLAAELEGRAADVGRMIDA
ncbi:MAG: hypothetical protein ACFCUS_05085 [Rubrimonas sp.]|uniref:hypothetical protein n=1 Tax=Rubrimonas sp. TaxID=2036015 RepID=UPI002FDDFF93